VLQVNNIATGIQFVISSTRSNIEPVLEQSETFLRERGVPAAMEAGMVLRELLLNSVVHGNCEDVSKTVDCTISLINGGGVLITVSDQGVGFDYRTINMELPNNPNRIRHRGFALVNALCSSLKFNESGTSVTAAISNALLGNETSV